MCSPSTAGCKPCVRQDTCGSRTVLPRLRIPGVTDKRFEGPDGLRVHFRALFGRVPVSRRCRWGKVGTYATRVNFFRSYRGREAGGSSFWRTQELMVSGVGLMQSVHASEVVRLISRP